MLILTPKTWPDYELLDSGNGQRLERFGKYLLIRPDPQAIWQKSLSDLHWQKADAIFGKFPGSDREHWKKLKPLPDQWTIKYEGLTILCKLSPFKHTGVFPEQSVHWEWIQEKINEDKKVPRGGGERGAPMSARSERNEMERARTSIGAVRRQDPEQPTNILNLFGYTGISSLISAQANAKVTHIDASYPTIGWAKENQKLSNLDQKPIRWILDDCLKFCERELKRGIKYDGIIMDPPIYGHGPKGEKWDFNKSFPELMELCVQLLSDQPLFLIVNAYAISASSIMLENVLNDFLKNLGGQIESGELTLQETGPEKRLLSTGIYARWSK